MSSPSTNPRKAIPNALTGCGLWRRILSHPHFEDLRREEAPMGERAQALLVHPEDYVHAIEQSSPTEGEIALDPDTWMNASTLGSRLSRRRRRHACR